MLATILPKNTAQWDLTYSSVLVRTQQGIRFIKVADGQILNRGFTRKWQLKVYNKTLQMKLHVLGHDWNTKEIIIGTIIKPFGR